MPICHVPWRSSGGRGEYEYKPSQSLKDRTIALFLEPLGITIPAEVYGRVMQGKPRLRKFVGNDRQKLHLPSLVMALARLPAPARQDKTFTTAFPLENKLFLFDEMDFDIISDDDSAVTLAPLRVSILHSNVVIDLQDRFAAIAADEKDLPAIRVRDPKLADAVQAHIIEVRKSLNSIRIRKAADSLIDTQAAIFGMTNAGSVKTVIDAEAMPETELESVVSSNEGRLLTRVHFYKERDPRFAAKVKKHAALRNGGQLQCQSCGLLPKPLYGPDGEKCLEAHHMIPIAELQPDSVTRFEDMAIVCASCHRMIHSQSPCLPVNQVRI